MSVESIDITADDDDESVDMDHVGDPERYGVYCGFNFFFLSFLNYLKIFYFFSQFITHFLFGNTMYWN